MRGPLLRRATIVLAWILAVSLGTFLTIVVLNKNERIETPCFIKSVIPVNFTCTGMYGRGPEWCTNEHILGYQTYILFESRSIPICADQKMCICCDSSACHDVINYDMECVPETRIPGMNASCYISNSTQHAYLQPYPINYAGLIFWSFFGYCICCALCYVGIKDS